MKENKPVSNYTLLTRWLFDGSTITQIPVEVVQDKSISQMYILYYFQMSHLNIYIDKYFNNYNLFALDRLDLFKFLKQSIQLCGYKPPFVKKGPKIKNKLVDILKGKYPYLKKEELFMLVDFIDNSEEKDSVYEMFGFYSPKKKKITDAERKRMKQKTSEQKDKEISLEDLMENFS